MGFILPLIVTATALSAAFDTLIGTLKAFDDQAQEMVRRGSQWSGPIAASAAMAGFKVSMAEFRRAMLLERDLVDYSSARADLSVSIKELVTSISRDLLPTLTSLVRVGTNGVNGLSDFREKAISSLAQQIVILRNTLAGFDADTLAKELAALKDVLAERGKPSTNMSDFIRDIESFFDPAVATQDFVRRGVTFADGRKL